MKLRRCEIFAVVLAAGVLLAACKRNPGGAPSAASASASAESGCLETNPRPEIAAACMACLKKNAIYPGNDGCCGIRDDVGRQLCEAAAKCMRNGRTPTGPCNAGGDTSTCYCGTHAANCWQPGVPNGPCIAEISAAAGRNIESQTTDSPNEDQILNRYGDVKYALGRASNVAAIAGGLCGGECEIAK